jgi:hypothetical protein
MSKIVIVILTYLPYKPIKRKREYLGRAHNIHVCNFNAENLYTRAWPIFLAKVTLLTKDVAVTPQTFQSTSLVFTACMHLYSTGKIYEHGNLIT